MHRSKHQKWKLQVTGLCEGNPPVTSRFLSERASNTENVFIWWHHHDSWKYISVFFLSLGFRSEAWKKWFSIGLGNGLALIRWRGFFLVQSLIYPLPSQMLCYIELLFNIELCDKDTPCDAGHIYHAMRNEVWAGYCRVSQGSLWSKMHVFWFTAGLFWENMSLSCSLELIDLISQKLSFWSSICWCISLRVQPYVVLLRKGLWFTDNIMYVKLRAVRACVKGLPFAFGFYWSLFSRSHLQCQNCFR